MTTIHATSALAAGFSGEYGNPRCVGAEGVKGWSELPPASVRAD